MISLTKILIILKVCNFFQFICFLFSGKYTLFSLVFAYSSKKWQARQAPELSLKQTRVYARVFQVMFTSNVLETQKSYLYNIY